LSTHPNAERIAAEGRFATSPPVAATIGFS
jgi:hypothetical protein